MAEHKDIDDEGQTVLITERIISIHTTATSEDGKKEIEAGKDVTIIDTVTLDGLEIGTKYQLKGWQMIKDENAELIINGERVENDYTFTADSESMEVQIAFLSLFGRCSCHGLVDDTVNADNLYSQYPLENYQLDFYVDNSWGWLPWNWLDGIGKSVQYGFTVSPILSGR